MNEQYDSIIVLTCPDRVEGNYDPEALGLACRHQGPTFINGYSQSATSLVDPD